MANRVDAIRRGVANYSEVYHHFAENQDTKTAAQAASQAIQLLRSAATVNGESKYVSLAMVVAWMNENFEESGKLWSVDDEGVITYTYVVSGHERKTIASLMAS